MIFVMSEEFSAHFVPFGYEFIVNLPELLQMQRS